jgi:hypothetical protein
MLFSCSVCYSGSTYQDNLEPDQLNTALGAIAQNRTQTVVSVKCCRVRSVQQHNTFKSVLLLLGCVLWTLLGVFLTAPVRINCHSGFIHEKNLGIPEWIFVNFDHTEFNGKLFTHAVFNWQRTTLADNVCISRLACAYLAIFVTEWNSILMEIYRGKWSMS